MSTDDFAKNLGGGEYKSPENYMVRIDLFFYPGQAHGMRSRQARDKQMDWFMMYLEPETKDAYFADKKATPAKES